MLEADVLLASEGPSRGQPVMAHPPETSSDISLQQWLTEVVRSSKGIKLDFKRYLCIFWFLQNKLGRVGGASGHA